jgi:hypothetical protein
VAFLRAWAVSRGPEDTPPDGWVPGANAARIVAAGARWRGDPAVLVCALSDPAVRLIEISDGGIRVLKMEPYADAWKKNAKARERLRKFRERNANETRTSTNVSGQTQTQTQTQKEETDLSPSSSAGAGQADLLPESPAPPGESPDDLRALWNTEKDPRLPHWRELTGKRRTQAAARLKERPLAEWRIILGRINGSPFCLGVNERGWKADVEFFLRPDTATKVLEGKYDPKPGQGPAPVVPIRRLVEM